MPTVSTTASSRWSALTAALARGFHAYANWLVAISWKRFILLSILLLIVSGILSELPPFSWTISQTVTDASPKVVVERKPGPKVGDGPSVRIEGAKSKSGGDEGVDISIGRDGVRITHGRARKAEAAASAASAASSPAQRAQAAKAAASAALGDIQIKLPPGPVADAVKQAIEEARREIDTAIDEAQAEEDGAQGAPGDVEEVVVKRPRVRKVSLGDFLPNLALLWIVASIMIKITYKGRLQAEVKAAQATETAESESLKRQVAEARMAALQAQVEPHFLFNTLASIDHLIETDPPRASTMQKNLITYLRATLHKMRESTTTLGREVDLVTAYLEILKVRMEDRLNVRIAVPAGLRSAAFPPMMLQSLVENAIRHGLEPSSEPGSLSVSAEVSDGALRVAVADTGVGFDPNNRRTGGTGLGLANVRERLALLYGPAAVLEIAPNAPRGTVVTLTLPYAVMPRAEAAAPATMPG
jgi:Histidine kinase/Histidine kinase-, DNA gyrase B-, and HSP90-like ATPase